MATPSNDETPVTKVMRYIFFDWLEEHMQLDCRADAIDSIPRQKGMQQEPYALHFKSTKVIENRHYSVELTKEPFVYFLKKLEVQWLPHLDAIPAPNFFLTIVTNQPVDHATGFYRIITASSEDDQFLVKFEINRD